MTQLPEDEVLPRHSLVLSYYVVHFPSRQVDEVLPSSVDRNTQQWLATQLKALYTLSERAALDAAAIPHQQRDRTHAGFDRMEVWD